MKKHEAKNERWWRRSELEGKRTEASGSRIVIELDEEEGIRLAD